MCEFTDYKHKKTALNFFNLLPNSNMVFSKVRQKLPNAFKPGHCAVCRKPLSKNERRPENRATRSMCIGCYDYNIANLYFSCCRTVQANFTRTSFTCNYISFESLAIIDIYNLNFFILNNIGCIH